MFCFSQTQYLVERHGDTLLPQYLGMYRLTVEGVETYMLVMRSVFSALPVHKKYDLKGSTIDRQATDKEKVGIWSVRKCEHKTRESSCKDTQKVLCRYCIAW